MEFDYNNMRFFLLKLNYLFQYSHITKNKANKLTYKHTNTKPPIHLGPVVRKPINANPRLKVNQGFHLAG